MNAQTVLYLSRRDIDELGLPMERIIDALELMFVEKGLGNVEMPPKPGIHPRKDCFIHAMPAYVSSVAAAGMKWVSGYPDNTRRGLPYINGLLILNDPETGIPIAVMDCTWITAMRTGAATAVAAKYLARKESSTVGIVACGVQGRSNLEALTCVLKIDRVRAFDVHDETARRYAKEMSLRLDVEIEPVGTAEEAVRGQDIVVTSGPIFKDPRPVLGAGCLAPGSFAALLDFDSYWQGDALRQADVLVTDDLSQMSYYRRQGYFRETPEPAADLGEIVAGKQPGRTAADQRTISINLGLALEDIVTAVRIYQMAVERGAGQRLPL